MDRNQHRRVMTGLLQAGLAAVDPESLTRRALEGRNGEPATLIAIGKASIGMCHGAVHAIGESRGICVSNVSGPVPGDIDLVIGNHPVPGSESFEAGRRVLEVAAAAPEPIIALISGGGSALCEHPIEGVTPSFISDVGRHLLDSGASISDANLVRRHLSAVKNGGVARVAGAPIDTYAISDVCGEQPSLIASGPTASMPLDPIAAIEVMARHGIDVPADVMEAIQAPRSPVTASPITVLADARTAAEGVVHAAAGEGIVATVADEWLRGDVAEALDRFLGAAKPGLTVAAGEPEVRVTGEGIGGRNTHAALLAAKQLAGSDAWFAAFATDGVDGNSTSAGAVVDGTTVERGGDPATALEASDSATYLETTGDLIHTGPTGTNVSDLWVLWR